MMWKVYFWILVAQLFAIPLSTIYMFGGSTFVDIGYWALLFGGVVGMYGYVFMRPIGRREFWMVFAVVFVVLDFIFNLGANMSGPGGQYLDAGMESILAVLLITLPEYYGLYRYGFSRGGVWDHT